MKKLLTVGFTVLVAASLSFAQRGETANKVRGGKGAFNHSSTREHKGKASNKSSVGDHNGEASNKSSVGDHNGEASNKSSVGDHKGGKSGHKGGKKGKKTGSDTPKGWDLKRNAGK
jgi:hypothetical protein